MWSDIQPRSSRFLKYPGRIQRTSLSLPERSNYKVDRETGQLLTETIVGMQVDDDKFWEYKSNNMSNFAVRLHTIKKPDLEQNSYKRKIKGSRSLLLMSLEKVVYSASDLNMELIEIMPKSLVEILWKKISEKLKH